MQEILAQRKKTLKHVNAGFHSSSLPEAGYHLNRGRFSSFGKFKALEKLLVEGHSISPVGDFTDLLPESLTLFGIRAVPKMWNGVEKLADKVRRGRFSQLKKVVLDLGQEEFEMARKKLDIAGIACVRYDYRYYPFG
ncbi:hypothetical protein ACHAPE_005902 [Trichoderma viride]